MTRRGRKIKRFSQCPFCFKLIPTAYLKHHKKVCRVRRGLDEPQEQTPDEDGKIQKVFTAKKGESIEELLQRIRKGE